MDYDIFVKNKRRSEVATSYYELACQNIEDARTEHLIGLTNERTTTTTKQRQRAD